MTRHRITALALALFLLMSLTACAGAASSNDLANEQADSSEPEYDEKAYTEGKAMLGDAINEVECPESEEYLMVAFKGWEYGGYDGYGEYSTRALFYVLDNGTIGYKTPDGKEQIIELPTSEPVVPVAERGGYYCVYVISERMACWVDKDKVSDNYYHQNDPVVDSLRDELSSWTDIKDIYVTNGSIIGLKKDGTTAAARFEPYGVDISNWGKLKSIDGCSKIDIHGISADSASPLKTMLYSPIMIWYANHNLMRSDNSAGSIENNDLRYKAGVKKYIGSIDYGAVVLMEDGTIHNATLSYIAEEDNWPMDYSFTQNGHWRYVDCDADTGKRTLYTDKDGVIDWNSGIDVTNNSKYDFENIAVNIVDICGIYPEEAFTAIQTDGELILYGWNAIFMNREGYTFNYDCIGANKLINERAGIKDGRVIALLETDGDDFTAGDNLHPEIYGAWENIDCAYIDSNAVVAVDRDGKIYLDVSEYAWADHGQYEAAAKWSDKVVEIVGDNDYDQETYGYLLGITEDGRVLISGVLPDEAA